MECFDSDITSAAFIGFFNCYLYVPGNIQSSIHPFIHSFIHSFIQSENGFSKQL